MPTWPRPSPPRTAKGSLLSCVSALISSPLPPRTSRCCFLLFPCVGDTSPFPFMLNF